MENLYKNTLVAFISYRDYQQYDKGHVFTREELAAVTADEVLGWFNYKAFGMPTPTLDDRPTQCRSNSLKYWKKALSHFMPNKHHQWNDVTNSGNPTCSQFVNDIIQAVVRFEVRKQGAPSKARRAMK